MNVSADRRGDAVGAVVALALAHVGVSAATGLKQVVIAEKPAAAAAGAEQRVKEK